MSTVKCKGCGRETNTAICEHQFIFGPDNYATKCYGAFVGNKVERGCAYDQADSFIKGYVDKLIETQPWLNQKLYEAKEKVEKKTKKKRKKK